MSVTIYDGALQRIVYNVIMHFFTFAHISLPEHLILTPLSDFYLRSDSEEELAKQPQALGALKDRVRASGLPVRSYTDASELADLVLDGMIIVLGMHTKSCV